MPRFPFALSLPIFVALLGCESDQNAQGRDASMRETSHSGSMPMPAATGDGEFAAMVAAHHESAIEMGKIESQRGQRAEVRKLASHMVEVQSREHGQLEQIARDEGHAEHKSNPSMEQHGKADLAALRSAEGVEVDRVFLTHMIDHHAQGIDMMKRSMPSLKRTDLRNLAEKMIADQNREIGDMRRMLNAH